MEIGRGKRDIWNVLYKFNYFMFYLLSLYVIYKIYIYYDIDNIILVTVSCIFPQYNIFLSINKQLMTQPIYLL